MNTAFRACVQSVCHEHAHMISDQLKYRQRPVQSQIKYASNFSMGQWCHESLFRTHTAAKQLSII